MPSKVEVRRFEEVKKAALVQKPKTKQGISGLDLARFAPAPMPMRKRNIKTAKDRSLESEESEEPIRR